MGFKKTIINTKKRNHRKRIQRKNKKNRTMKKGGFWPFTNTNQSVIMTPNPISNYSTDLCFECPKGSGFMDRQYFSRNNPVWKTCITVHNKYNRLIYVTPRNVIIKSVQSIQIPNFNVKINDQGNYMLFQIMIRQLFINCFILYCGNWYVSMRLVDNDELSENNTLFYKLKNGIKVELMVNTKEVEGNGLIIIPSGTYDKISKLSEKSKKEISIIQLKDNNMNFESITEEKNNDTWEVLITFRRQKIVGNVAKIVLNPLV